MNSLVSMGLFTSDRIEKGNHENNVRKPRLPGIPSATLLISAKSS